MYRPTPSRRPCESRLSSNSRLPDIPVSKLLKSCAMPPVSCVRLAVPGPQESGEEPGRRQIGIEHERPVEQGNAAGKVIGEVGERMPAAGERYCIVPAQVDGPARQAGALGDLAWAIGHPAVDLAPENMRFCIGTEGAVNEASSPLSPGFDP